MGYQFTNNYPSSASVFPTMVDHVDPVNHEYFTGLHTEIQNIETELGLEPKGIFASVKAWLTSLQEEIVNNNMYILDVLGPDPAYGFDNLTLRLSDMDERIGVGFDFYINAYVNADNAIWSELGSNPSGSFSTVVARLNDLDTGSNIYFQKSLSFIDFYTGGVAHPAPSWTSSDDENSIEAFEFDKVSIHAVATWFIIDRPPKTGNITITFYYFTTVTSGEAGITYIMRRYASGSIITGTGSASIIDPMYWPASASSGGLKVVTFTYTLSNWFVLGDFVKLNIYRQGLGGSDTLDGSVFLIGAIVKEI